MNNDLKIKIALYVLFFFLLLAFIVIEMIIYLKKAKKYKDKIMAIKDIDLSKDQFKKDYDIKCDYCGNIFNTSNSTCPNCQGAYSSNKQYLEEMKKSNTEYYHYLEHLQQELKVKLDTYCKVLKDLKKNLFVNHNCFNYTIDIPSKDIVENVQIFCEYCGTKIDLKINDEVSCPNCGSTSKDNMELKAYLKKNEVLELECEKYRELNDIIREQNKKNNTHDSFLMANYWYAKLVMILLFVLPLILSLTLYRFVSIEVINKVAITFAYILGATFELLILYVLYRVFIKKKQ